MKSLLWWVLCVCVSVCENAVGSVVQQHCSRRSVMLLTYQNTRSFETPLNLSLKNYLLLHISCINVKTAQKKTMANLG